jgi:hypothetical protein
MSKAQGLDGEDVPNEGRKNARSSLSRGIVIKLIHHT